jgi:hypothetical protein
MHTIDITKHLPFIYLWMGQWVDQDTKQAPEIAVWLRKNIGPQKIVQIKSDKIVVRGKGWKVIREWGSEKVILLINDDSYVVMARLMWS